MNGMEESPEVDPHIYMYIYNLLTINKHTNILKWRKDNPDNDFWTLVLEQSDNCMRKKEPGHFTSHHIPKKKKPLKMNYKAKCKSYNYKTSRRKYKIKYLDMIPKLDT